MAEVFDGFTSLLDGMDSGIRPSLLKTTAYARGINVSCRGGSIRTRPGFVKVADLPAGVFRNAGVWSLESGDRIVSAIGDTVHILNLSNTLGHTFQNGFSYNCHFAQPDKWFLVQDGYSRPMVFEDNDGTPVLYGRDAPEVCYVPGTVAFYAHGRVHYVPTYEVALTPDPEAYPDVVPNLFSTNGRTSFVSSDICDVLGDPQWVFRMSEHRILNEGGGLKLPLELGYITAMSAQRNSATGTGVGALVVFARNGVSAFDVSLARSQWKNNAISQVLFFGAGTQSPLGVAPVNSDLFYVDTVSHLRSIKYSGSAAGNSLATFPVSGPLEYFVDQSDLTLLSRASIAFVNDRVVWTICGEDNYFKALGVLDTAQITGMSEADAPSFDGVWTGFKFLQVLKARWENRDTLFVIVKGEGEANALFRLDESAVTDGGNNIECQLMTRAMNFSEAPIDLKVLQYCDTYLADMNTDVAYSVYYRPLSNPVWGLFGEKTFSVPSGGLPQSRRKIRFGLDPSASLCDPVTGDKLFKGNEFQFCLKWTGSCIIDIFRVCANVVAEANLPCSEDNANGVVVPENTLFADFSYEVSV